MQCIVVGAAGWGVNILALDIFARAIGVDVSWTVFAVAIPVTLVATLTPFSVNGLGIREGVLVGMLTHAGVSTGHAAAIAVLVDLQMLPFGILGAGLWMRHRRRSAAPVDRGGRGRRVGRRARGRPRRLTGRKRRRGPPPADRSVQRSATPR